MALTFQVPRQHCSLQHRTLLSPPDASTAGCCFHFGSASSFFLELFPYFSTVVYWTPTTLGSSSFSVTSFSFHAVRGVLKAGILKWFAFFSSGPSFSGSDYQRHAFSCSTELGDTRCAGCPTAGPRLVCKPSLAVGCWSKCCRGLRQRSRWSGWEGGLGKTATDVGGHPVAEGSPASLLPLAALGLIHRPRVEGEHM